MVPDDARPRPGRGWLVDVSDADIAAAKDAWTAAGGDGSSAERVAELYGRYAGLVRTQSRQVAAAFRRAHGR